ncbi:MAG TPA: flagellar motor protein MotB [Stellaceae bacterium]|nr:flagellar motor protein MotB [Stellaceae bacterium]
MTADLDLVGLSAPIRPRASANPLWMLSFVDLISLLVAFFMLLFALSGRSPEEWQQVAAPIAAYWHGDAALTSPDLAPAPARPTVSRNFGLRYVAMLVQGWQTADPVLAQLQLTVGDDRLRLELPPDLVSELASGQGNAVAGSAQAMLGHIGSQLSALGNPVDVVVTGIGSPDQAEAWSDAIALAQSVAEDLATAGLRPAASGATLDPMPGATRRIDLVIREAEGLH